MITLDEKFKALEADNAPGQEVRQEIKSGRVWGTRRIGTVWRPNRDQRRGVSGVTSVHFVRQFSIDVRSTELYRY